MFEGMYWSWPMGTMIASLVAGLILICWLDSEEP